MEKPKRDFLTFSELAARWECPDVYLHDLVRTGKIVPAIALTDQERYVGGEFRGGYLVGDIENAKHQSYAEYYVGTIVADDDHYENRPQCNRLMYCHCPADEANGGYSFQFVSSSPSPGDSAIWFYLDHGARIGCMDGEQRFRFEWVEIDRFEAEDSIGSVRPKGASAAIKPSIGEAAVLQPTTVSGPVRHKLVNRTHVLHAEIEEAKKKAVNPADANSVWSELVKLAESESGCFLGVVDGQLKYRKSNGEAGYFNLKALRGRMRR